MKREGMHTRVTIDEEKPGHITTDTPWKNRAGIEAIMTKAQAVDLLQRAHGKTPADWLSWTHLGTARHICGATQAGLEAAQIALKMYRSPLTLLNVAVILETLGRFNEAMELSAEAVRLDPSNQFSGLLHAQGLLRQGKWEEGWEPFEWYSWGTLWEDELAEYVDLWEGQDLAGKSILVIQGGGFGDNLMFFRWFEDLKRAGARVTYACPAGLVPLLEGHPWVDCLIPVHEQPGLGELPEFDFHVVKDGVRQYDYFVPIMGLARRFKARLPLPWNGPYITAKQPMFKEALAAVDRPVGVCWMGAEKLDPRRHRSLNPLQIRRLLGEKRAWVNLQYGISPPGRALLFPLRDFADTAALIAELDLVITVDTAVMHLAGAMGVPTWVILPGLSDWKFLLGSGGMPFYPSVRLFRNDGEGLDNALDRCIEALRGDDSARLQRLA